MATDPNRKHYRNERMSASDLLHYLATEAQHLRVVLDHEYPLPYLRPYLWVVKAAAVEDKPARFTVLDSTEALERELTNRRLFGSLTPGGWIRFRKVPEDSA